MNEEAFKCRTCKQRSFAIVVNGIVVIAAECSSCGTRVAFDTEYDSPQVYIGPDLVKSDRRIPLGP